MAQRPLECLYILYEKVQKNQNKSSFITLFFIACNNDMFMILVLHPFSELPGTNDVNVTDVSFF